MELTVTSMSISSTEMKVQLMSTFVFATYIVHVICNNHTTFDTQNFKTLAIFSGCTHWFMSDIVRNPEDLFYGDIYDMAPLHSHKSHYIENDSNKQTAFVLSIY